jgi:hypothetical protein
LGAQLNVVVDPPIAPPMLELDGIRNVAMPFDDISNA